MSRVRFEEPPDVPISPVNDMLDELRDHPGEWGLISEGTKNPHGTAMRIKRGLYTRSEPGEFEVTTRRIGDGTVSLWARWVGKNDNEEGDATDPQDQ